MGKTISAPGGPRGRMDRFGRSISAIVLALLAAAPGLADPPSRRVDPRPASGSEAAPAPAPAPAAVESRVPGVRIDNFDYVGIDVLARHLALDVTWTKPD